jgi:uncharacterized protein
MHRIAAAALAAALPLLAAIPLPPAPTRYVTDAANVIPDDREAALNAKLAQHERETSNQLIVYVDRAVPAGTTIEEMGAEAIRTWGVGQAKTDNGAILFLFIDDRQSRIEVGYGLEGTLTDAASKRILVDLRPLLASADYAGAAELGANRIIETIAAPRPDAYAQVEQSRRDAVQARAAELEERENKIFIPMILASIGFLWFLGYALYRILIVRDWKLGSSGGSSWSGSSSSSSSSGFSGGGGSGGGGGASDRW